MGCIISVRRNFYYLGVVEMVFDRYDLLDVIIGVVDNIGYLEEGVKKVFNEVLD